MNAAELTGILTGCISPKEGTECRLQAARVSMNVRVIDARGDTFHPVVACRVTMFVGMQKRSLFPLKYS